MGTQLDLGPGGLPALGDSQFSYPSPHLLGLNNLVTDHNICSVGAKTIFCWKLGTFEGLTCFTGFSNFLLTLQPTYLLTESATVLLLKENSIFLILDLLFTYLDVYLIYTYQQFWNWFGK